MIVVVPQLTNDVQLLKGLQLQDVLVGDLFVEFIQFLHLLDFYIHNLVLFVRLQQAAILDQTFIGNILVVLLNNKPFSVDQRRSVRSNK